ncbi:MAG TPA: UbiH/UbiF family hydroxylase [Xanthobacteraceae bacterium]|nr:UbiH/UbiF family hydroxylase [Xanthobacteraceae bacterium]
MPADGALIVEVAVVGAGPAGLAAAVALAGAGVDTALMAPAHRGDNRTTALLAGSVAALEALGVWQRCYEYASPLTAIRIIDDRRGLLQAPEVLFEAQEIGLAAFGHNIENRHLLAALAGRAAELASLHRIEAAATDLEHGDRGLTLRAADERRVQARIVIGADGRDSLCRKAAGIETESWTYPQTALTCNVEHTRPHQRVSTEFHTSAGPFTLVPLSGQRSSLVWVAGPASAARLQDLDEDAFSLAAERQAHSLLGKMRLAGSRAAFPLAGHTARRLAASRVALIGEAAHLMPPIGAQGFNLGIRDAATAAELIVAARKLGDDPGSPELLRRYEDMRRMDVRARTIAVDLLNRSLLSDFLPLQGLRGLGLSVLERIGPLRRAVMREGVMPRINEPRLMRGERL